MNGVVESAQEMWLPKVCIKLCVCVFLCACGWGRVLLWRERYVFMFLCFYVFMFSEVHGRAQQLAPKLSFFAIFKCALCSALLAHFQVFATYALPKVASRAQNPTFAPYLRPSLSALESIHITFGRFLGGSFFGVLKISQH